MKEYHTGAENHRVERVWDADLPKRNREDRKQYAPGHREQGRTTRSSSNRNRDRKVKKSKRDGDGGREGTRPDRIPVGSSWDADLSGSSPDRERSQDGRRKDSNREHSHDEYGHRENLHRAPRASSQRRRSDRSRREHLDMPRASPNQEYSGTPSRCREYSDQGGVLSNREYSDRGSEQINEGCDSEKEYSKLATDSAGYDDEPRESVYDERGESAMEYSSKHDDELERRESAPLKCNHGTSRYTAPLENESLNKDLTSSYGPERNKDSGKDRSMEDNKLQGSKDENPNQASKDGNNVSRDGYSGRFRETRLMLKKLYSVKIDCIPDGITEWALDLVFSSFGTVQDSYIPPNTDKSGNRFGFVRFQYEREALDAINADVTLLGKKILMHLGLPIKDPVDTGKPEAGHTRPVLSTNRREAIGTSRFDGCEGTGVREKTRSRESSEINRPYRGVGAEGIDRQRGREPDEISRPFEEREKQMIRERERTPRGQARERAPGETKRSRSESKGSSESSEISRVTPAGKGSFPGNFQRWSPPAKGRSDQVGRYTIVD